jgi:hypothetical protein
MIDSYIARRRGKATTNERQRRIDWKRIEQRTNRHSVRSHEIRGCWLVHRRTTAAEIGHATDRSGRIFLT